MTVLCILYACPFSSVYKLDPEPVFPIDESYLGNWATTTPGKQNRSLPVRMTLSKRTDSLYDICFTGDLRDLYPYRIVENDSIKGAAFLSDVKGNKVINILINNQCFIAELRDEGSSISLLPFSEHFTNRIIRRNSELRLYLEWHYASRVKPLYDEGFSLRNMVRVK